MAPFLSKFEALVASPRWKRNPVASDFVDTLYKAGGIAEDFKGTEWKNWVEWKGSDEALRLRDALPMRSNQRRQSRWADY